MLELCPLHNRTNDVQARTGVSPCYGAGNQIRSRSRGLVIAVVFPPECSKMEQVVWLVLGSRRLPSLLNLSLVSGKLAGERDFTGPYGLTRGAGLHETWVVEKVIGDVR